MLYRAHMLVLDGLVKNFGTLRAVDGLSLRVNRGEIFGLLGPNGAGKSTTISMAIGLITPDAGSVTYQGLGSPTHHMVRKNVGVAPQTLAIYQELTGEENVLFFARLQGVDNPRVAARDALERVGLTARAHDRAGTYSGGMQRRLNLAAAFFHKPPLLLLDEPTAGVDPQSRTNILELVRELANEGAAILYTTHYMEEAQKICDRVGIMDEGKVLVTGSVEELLAKHGKETLVMIERPGGETRISTNDPLREVTSALEAGDVTGLRVERADLETVFLSLTGKRLRD